MRVYAIWPADREGVPASSPAAWHQHRHWLVLDVTDGEDRPRVVEGPVTLTTALQRELELYEVARALDGDEKGSQ